MITWFAGFCGAGVPPAVFCAYFAAANRRRDAGATKPRTSRPLRGKSTIRLHAPLEMGFRCLYESKEHNGRF